jgi:hypothetical protein
MEMLKKCPIWSIFKYHHPGKGMLFLTVAKQVHKILVTYFGQACDLKPLLFSSIKVKQVVSKQTEDNCTIPFSCTVIHFLSTNPLQMLPSLRPLQFQLH